MDWQLTDAKNKFSELLSMTTLKGPQRIRRRRDSFIILKEEEYDRLLGKRLGFKSFLHQKAGLDELDVSRDLSPMRDFDL